MFADDRSIAKERGARMERLEKRRKLTYSTAARACLCTASSSTTFRAVSSVHLVFLLSLKFREGFVCLCALLGWRACYVVGL